MQDCTGNLSGKTVTLTAVPDVGYVLQWSGDLSGSAGPASIFMDESKTVTATFVQSDARYNIAVEVASADFGTVTLMPSQPDGGYLINQPITVTANGNTDAGYIFSHWEGDLTGNTNPASIIANDNKTITAVFNATMTVISEPVDTGTVSLEPSRQWMDMLLARRYSEGYCRQGLQVRSLER